MDRAPDLALEIDQRRSRQEQADQHHEALDDVAQRRTEAALVHPVAEGGEIAAADQKPGSPTTTTAATSVAPTRIAVRCDEELGRVGDALLIDAYSAA